MQLTFYTPSYKNADGFGGATFGFAGAENEMLSLAKVFPEDVVGTAFYGSYEDILNTMPQVPCQAAIVLLGNAGGENAFIQALAGKIKAPLVGGSGAICPQTGKSALISGGGEAAVLAIHDDRFNISVTAENVHRDVISEHSVVFDGRYFVSIDGEDPVIWYNEKRSAFGLSDTDFEHLTLADSFGINAHLSYRDGRLFSGRDLSDKMMLRYLPKEKAQERIQTFYDDENAIVFGCAGLKQTLSAGICSNALGLFMFGEVCTINGHSDFGNLMLSKIKFTKK